MNQEIKAQWVAALRSGKYEQGKKALRAATGQFCCLGVLCDLHSQVTGTPWKGLSYESNDGMPSTNVMQWAGLATDGYFKDRDSIRVEIDGNREWLDLHNDSGKTFAQIADAIEAQL